MILLTHEQVVALNVRRKVAHETIRVALVAAGFEPAALTTSSEFEPDRPFVVEFMLHHDPHGDVDPTIYAVALVLGRVGAKLKKVNSLGRMLRFTAQYDPVNPAVPVIEVLVYPIYSDDWSGPKLYTGHLARIIFNGSIYSAYGQSVPQALRKAAARFRAAKREGEKLVVSVPDDLPVAVAR